MAITFTCKDQKLADWYEKLWRGRFEAELAEYRGSLGDAERAALIEHWRTLMSEDARRQEHYDYTVDENGVDRLRQDNGALYHLLFPEVEIV